MSNPEIAFKKPAPPEWEPLVAQFDVIAASDRPFKQQAEEGLGIINGMLDRKSREDNRTHGLGQVTCRFYEILADPEVRQGVIAMSGEHLASKVEPADRGVLRRKHLLSTTIRYGMFGAVQGAFNEQPAGQSLLVGALTAAAYIETYNISPKYAANRDQLRRDIAEDFGRREIRDYFQNVVSGVNRSFREAIAIIAKERKFQNPDNYPLPHNEWLRTLGQDLYVPSARGASKRLDIFNDAPWYIELTEDGKWRANMEQFKEPEEIDFTKTLHAETHGCVAQYVGDTIKQMLGIYTEILIDARQRLVNRQRPTEWK